MEKVIIMVLKIIIGVFKNKCKNWFKLVWIWNVLVVKWVIKLVVFNLFLFFFFSDMIFW